MVKADPLSHCPDHDNGTDDNLDMTLLKPEWFTCNKVPGVSLLVQKIHQKLNNYENSAWVKLLIGGEDWRESEDSLIYRRGQIVVPLDKALWGEIISVHHDAVSAGQARTQELVYWSYWWPSIKKDVKAYIKGCEMCQRTKIDYQPKHAPLNPNPIADHNWEHWSVDLITHLPESHGYNSILNVTWNPKTLSLLKPPMSWTQKDMPICWSNMWFLNMDYQNESPWIEDRSLYCS